MTTGIINDLYIGEDNSIYYFPERVNGYVRAKMIEKIDMPKVKEYPDLNK